MLKCILNVCMCVLLQWQCGEWRHTFRQQCTVTEYCTVWTRSLHHKVSSQHHFPFYNLKMHACSVHSMHMWLSYFGSIPFSDSNLNRYEVHPTRTVSEGTGPEFYTHFRVGQSKPDRLIGLCLKIRKLMSTCMFFDIRCRIWAVTPSVIWSWESICLPWLQETEFSRLWLMLSLIMLVSCVCVYTILL